MDGDVRNLGGLIATDRKKSLFIVTDFTTLYSRCFVVLASTCPFSEHSVSGTVALWCAI